MTTFFRSSFGAWERSRWLGLWLNSAEFEKLCPKALCLGDFHLPFLWTRHLENAPKEFLQSWHKPPRGLKDECVRIWVFLFTTTNRKTTQMSAQGFTAGSPHRSAPGETLTGNNPHPPDYSSWQTSFTTWAGCNDVDFTASSYAKSGLSLLHSPKNCSGWDAHCACRATHYQCTSKNL